MLTEPLASKILMKKEDPDQTADAQTDLSLCLNENSILNH